jgi:hypothetical protein
VHFDYDDFGDTPRITRVQLLHRHKSHMSLLATLRSPKALKSNLQQNGSSQANDKKRYGLPPHRLDQLPLRALSVSSISPAYESSK